MPLRVDDRRSVGRPRKTNGRTFDVNVRLNTEEVAALERLCKSTGRNVSDVLRTALLYFDLVRSEKG